jgi:hypothetical protein
MKHNSFCVWDVIENPELEIPPSFHFRKDKPIHDGGVIAIEEKTCGNSMMKLRRKTAFWSG